MYRVGGNKGGDIVRVVDQHLKTITEYELSKGTLVPTRAVRENATPIDNVFKWAWADDDYEEVLMYVETPQETEEYVSPEAKELEAIKNELQGLRDGIDYLVNAVKKLG